MTDPVLFHEIPAGGGRIVGVATLDSPATLNGLSLPMCHLLHVRLKAWATDDRVAVVVLHGAGDRAFCAGGDLQALYRSMRAAPLGDAWAIALARDFFEAEYRLDFQIHRYPKPIVCWGSGVVMGGGVGLMMGASHRVVTETTRFAMPEISIGLYPDVAGTWMLSHLPRGIGLFLAWTGSRLEAADCLHYGLADWLCAGQDFEALIGHLSATDWSPRAAGHFSQVDAVLEALHQLPLAPGPLQQHAGTIRQACGLAEPLQVATTLAGWQGHDNPWLARAAATFVAGSPGTARLSHTLIELARHRSLADTLRTEYVASLHCCAEPDFREGIRALLIDKDKTPHWQPATLPEASIDWVARFFVEPWPAGHPHPLADLGP